MPADTFVTQNGVTIEHYGSAPPEHGPAHVHVKGGRMRIENLSKATKALGVAGYVIHVLDLLDAQKRADEHRISVWSQMTADYYEGMGCTVIYPSVPPEI